MRELIVNSCVGCVFLDEEYEQKVCSLISFWGLTWKDEEMGMDEMYQANKHPLSCPLRNGGITVKLKEGI